MEYIKWVIIYLIFSLIFAQCFKETNRSMKNASALTILLEIFTALFAIILSPLFAYKFSLNPEILLTLGVVTIIYAATDRLNIEQDTALLLQHSVCLNNYPQCSW